MKSPETMFPEYLFAGDRTHNWNRVMNMPVNLPEHGNKNARFACFLTANLVEFSSISDYFI